MDVTEINLSENDLAWLEMAEQRLEAMRDEDGPAIPQSEFFNLVEDS